MCEAKQAKQSEVSGESGNVEVLVFEPIIMASVSCCNLRAGGRAWVLLARGVREVVVTVKGSCDCRVVLVRAGISCAVSGRVGCLGAAV